MAIVYKYTSPSGKSYIGQTSTDRQNREGKNGLYYKQCTAFYNAILKYGLENFQYEILEKDISLEEAEKITGISHSNIVAVCNGRRKTAGGFIWKYKLDVPRLIPME